MNDIFLINPPQPKPDNLTLKYSPPSPPLGLCYLSPGLKAAGFKVTGWDFELKENTISRFLSLLAEKKPLIAGITSLTNTALTALTVAKLIKNHSPETLIALGGQHPAFCYEELLNYDFIDYILPGEAEKSFVMLCEAIKNNQNIHNIKGIAYRKQSKISISLPDIEPDLDNIPFPDRDLFDITGYFDPVSIVSSRGCNAKCIFCSATAFRKSKVRFRSSENILAEIELVYKKGFHVVNFVDDNFLMKKQRIKEICHGIQKHFPELFWTCSARADLVDKEIIKLLAQSGCKGIHFGVETASEDSQKYIGKYLSLQKLENALIAADKNNLRTFCSFIIGLPNEDEQQIRKNIQFAINLHKRHKTSPVFGLLTPFPGTPICNNPEKYDIKIISKNYSDYDIFTPVI